MDIGKLILLGGAAYLGYSYFLKPAAPTTTPAPGGIQPVTTANPLTTQNLIQAAASKAGVTSTNADGWGYYYLQARGIPAPAPNDLGFTDTNVNEILTFPEWWAIASSHGLSGYRRV